MATFVSTSANPQQMLLPLHQIQQLNQMQQIQSDMTISPTTLIQNHVSSNSRSKPRTSIENETLLSKNKESNNTIIANVTNHESKQAGDTSADLEPLNPDSLISPGSEKPISDLKHLGNGFCDNSENIYGNILESPPGKELKSGAEKPTSNIELGSHQDEHDNNDDETDIIIPIVSSKGIKDIASALQHTRNQLIIKHQKAIKDQEGNRGFAGDLAAQLGILVLREKQKQREEQIEELQQLCEMQQINQYPLTSASSNLIPSSNGSPSKKSEQHNHCPQTHKTRHRKKSNPICSRNDSGGASVISNLSKAASMSELDGPEMESLALLNEITTCTGEKGNSSGQIEAVKSPEDPAICYNVRSGRKRKAKKARTNTCNQMETEIRYVKNSTHCDDPNISTTVIAPFCGNCAATTLSRVDPCACELQSGGQADHASYNKSSLNRRQNEERHHLTSRSCGRISEAISPPFDISGPSSCKAHRKDKRTLASLKNQAPNYFGNPHEQQFHYLNSHHHRHHDHHHMHVNDINVITSENHESLEANNSSYHHYHNQQLNHNNHAHRSQGQLLIDDADILHQCLVSLAGERNVAMLLKRFQQRQQQTNSMKDPSSPC